MSECEPVSLAKHRPFLDGCSAKIRSPQRGMRDSLLPGNSRGVVEQVQVRVTASPRRMVPPLSTDAVYADIHRIVLGGGPEDPRIFGQVVLRQGDHHAPGAGLGDGQADRVADRQGDTRQATSRPRQIRRSGLSRCMTEPGLKSSRIRVKPQEDQ
jgi:hypothetical protein